VLDNSPALISVTGVDGRFRYVNRPLAKTFGMSAEAARGLTAEDVREPEAARLHRDNELSVLSTRQPHQFESVFAAPDGDRTYLTGMFPVFGGDGTIYATASIATDITGVKRAEAERESLGERLRQSERLESLGQLAGGVAHDFNNILGVILNYATFVAQQTTDNPAVQADVGQIRSAAERAARLTRQLLIVGRREAIAPEILELNAIVADIRDLLARSLGEHIELVLSLSALPAIRADRGQMEQVLLNLAVNARDAMPSGGTLAITTRLADVDENYVRLHPDAMLGRHVELTVHDTGMGMSPDVARHMFEPFFTTKPKGQGTGLGLATVYSIVTEAGGSIDVTSQLGTGTTIVISLPAAVDESLAPVAEPVLEHLAGRGQLILVVDDEPAMADVTARILRDNGYRAIEANSGAEALAMLADSDVWLLLTDTVMPHMSGRDLVANVRKLRPELPVLFMTGYDGGVPGAPHGAGHSKALLQKPFDAQTLLWHVDAVTTVPHTSRV
jgi:two-component system, cell cycle sensor histidine kinase and response regulator CckA